MTRAGRRQREAEEEKHREEKEQRARLVRARFRFLEQHAALWLRRQRLLSYLEAVRAKLDDPRVNAAERTRAMGWLEWADGYLKRRDPTNLLFWNPLIEENDKLFTHYSWTPSYGQP